MTTHTRLVVKNILALVFTLSIIFAACKKDLNIDSNNSDIVLKSYSGSPLQIAQQWLKDEKTKPRKALSDDLPMSQIEAKWDSLIQVNYDSTKLTEMYIPLKYQAPLKALLHLKIDSTQSVMGIIEIYDPSQQNDEGVPMSAYFINGEKFLEGIYMVDNNKLKVLSMRNFSNNTNVRAANKFMEDNVWDGGELEGVTVVGGGGGFKFTWTPFDFGNPFGNHNFNFGGPKNGGGSTGGGGKLGSGKSIIDRENEDIKEIKTDEIKDPCVRKTINEALSSNKELTGKIAEIINKFSGKNNGIEITVVDDLTTGDAYTQPFSLFGEAPFKAVVHLNPSHFLKSTKENLVLTMIHEVVHAYLLQTNYDYRIQNTALMHNEIYQKYVKELGLYMMQKYQMDEISAFSMAWNGLSDVFSQFENFPTLDGRTISKTEISQNLFKYTGIKGDPESPAGTEGTALCD